MKPTHHAPHKPPLLSLPRGRNRNCEGPVKGHARWRGSLWSPLTGPSQFPVYNATMEAKEKN